LCKYQLGDLYPYLALTFEQTSTPDFDRQLDSISMSRALENIDWGEPEPEPIPLKFSGSFEHLPATAPANHSHIVDLSSYDPDMEEEQYDVKVWDAVITILYKLSEETVSEFLSSSVKTFQLVHGYEKSRSDVKLVIWRQGSEVMV
jgi:hypothetical protein